MPEDSGALDFDLAVSSLAADDGDTQLMMRMLATRLAPVLGDRLRVDRAGGLLGRSNLIRRVELRVGAAELVAELEASPPSFSIGRISGGIRIRTDRIDAAGWIRALLEGLRTEAEHSTTARQALEAIVIGGSACQTGPCSFQRS